MSTNINDLKSPKSEPGYYGRVFVQVILDQSFCKTGKITDEINRVLWWRWAGTGGHLVESRSDSINWNVKEEKQPVKPRARQRTKVSKSISGKELTYSNSFLRAVWINKTQWKEKKRHEIMKDNMAVLSANIYCELSIAGYNADYLTWSSGKS